MINSIPTKYIIIVLIVLILLFIGYVVFTTTSIIPAEKINTVAI